MESRLIYAILNSELLRMDWQTQSSMEWIHIGTGKELKTDLLIQLITHTFEDDPFFIAAGRNTSKQIDGSKIEQEILPRVGIENFKLSSLDFEKIIEFSRVGVMRIGQKSKSNP